MRSISRVPFFANPAFFPSPPKSFQLLEYVESLCRDYVAFDPRPSSRAHLVGPHVLEFVDDCAVESDIGTPDSKGSSSSSD